MNDAPIDTFETLAGGRRVKVRNKDGTTETVFVRQLPVRLLPEYLKLQDDEPGLIELVCEKPAKWADGLTYDSHVELVDAVEEMNKLPFLAWLRRKVRRAEQLAPGSTGEQGKALLSQSSDGSLSARSGVA